MGSNKSTGQDFTNFPPVPDGHTRVFLNRTFGEQHGKLYGPGWSHVPDRLLAAIEQTPDLVRTDMTGRALDDTTAASTIGPRSDSIGATGIPHPERTADDEDAELVNPDGPTDEVTAHRARLAEAAQGERTGGQSIGETGSHLDTSRTLNPQPGQLSTSPEHVTALATEHLQLGRNPNPGTTGAQTNATDTARTDTTADEGPKPASKTALRKVGVDDLRAIAAEKSVKIGEDDDKETIVEKLYDARVSLDD